MRIRLRGPSGASTLNLKEDATVGDLHSEIKEKTSLTSFNLKYGYPPKPLYLDKSTVLLASLDVRLDGEQITVSAHDEPDMKDDAKEYVGNRQTADKDAFLSQHKEGLASGPLGQVKFAGMSNTKVSNEASSPTTALRDPMSLKRKGRDTEVPELPLPDRGATMVLRVMPDDNSCLFRAFGTAVLPGDDLSMPELRSLVAAAIQAQPEVYTRVVLEQNLDDYCTWIQTEDAWGGAIELAILSQHFDIEICSIDVQSLRIDRFNEGRPTRCILVYSGIHYDTIVQSPSEPPYTKADNPPELDKRVWDSDDDEILKNAQELCKKLQDQHYYTDTGGMAIKCQICGWVGYGEGQAQGHASQTGHYDMEEQNTK